MDKENLEGKISLDEEKARVILKGLLENAKTVEDLNEIHCLIEDYLERGYKFREYILEYNKIVKKICGEK